MTGATLISMQKTETAMMKVNMQLVITTASPTMAWLVLISLAARMSTLAIIFNKETLTELSVVSIKNMYILPAYYVSNIPFSHQLQFSYDTFSIVVLPLHSVEICFRTQ
jgi:hypothetical protein